MNRLVRLAATPSIAVARFDHPEGAPHRDPLEERAERRAVGLLERGAYEARVGRRNHRLVPGMAFVHTPGLVYSSRHGAGGLDDVFLTVAFSGAFEEDFDLLAGRAVTAPATNRLAYGRLRLAAAIEAGAPALDLEARALDLLHAVSAAGDAPAGTAPFRPARLGFYARRVDEARQRIEAEYAEDLPLATLSRTAAMSPFHFTRVFRELTGCPPHRYLLRVRLDQAARRLRRGMAVTETCFDVGFSNLSHFVRRFRSAYGVTPSRFH